MFRCDSRTVIDDRSTLFNYIVQDIVLRCSITPPRLPCMIFFRFLSKMSEATSASCSVGSSHVHMHGRQGPLMQRLTAVQGHRKKKNDLLFYGDLSETSARSSRKHVIFFQGDVQNFSEEMELHKDNWQWKRWSLETTARLLYKRFPDSYVWIICPTRRHHGTYCCYDNFLHTDDHGRPLSLAEPQGSLLHLQELLYNGVNSVNKKFFLHPTPTLTAGVAKSPSYERGIEKDLPLIVVGFSKGCLVLCQLLRDLYFSGLHNSKPEVNWFQKRVEHMCWLDGGNMAFSLSEDMFNTVSSLKTSFDVHTTPYQIQDPDRPLIRMEERVFVDTLKKLGANIVETTHFKIDDRSLLNHFSVLNIF